MTREELLMELQWIADGNVTYPHDPWKKVDTCRSHEQADQVLLRYINDPEVEAVYNCIDKWYD